MFASPSCRNTYLRGFDSTTMPIVARGPAARHFSRPVSNSPWNNGMRTAFRALLSALLIAVVGHLAPADDLWQVGVARRNITPDQPVWMAGYAARTEPSDGKLHEIYVKALALATPVGDRCVILTSDLIGIPRDVSLAVVDQVQAKFDLPPDALLLNASHTHTGPELRPILSRMYDIPPPYRQRVAQIRAQVIDHMVACIGAALDDLQPATLHFSESSASFARNRRFPTENGFINRRYDDGPVDHTVPVLAVKNAQGQLRAILFGYACHNTVLSVRQISGDYAGFAQHALEENHPNALAMFVAGAGGDQNPYPRREIELARTHGRSLADAVEKTLESDARTITPQLSAARATADLDFAPPPSREELESWMSSDQRYRRHKAQFLLDRYEQIPESYPCPVQALRLGERLVLIAIGGEVVIDYALRLRREFDAHDVWIAGYSNDVFGYLPSRRVLLEGGYEAGDATRTGPLPGPFTETVEDRVITAVHHVVDQVTSN